MKTTLLGIIILLAAIYSSAFAEVESQFNYSLSWKGDGYVGKYTHRNVCFSGTLEDEINVGRGLGHGLSLYGTYIGNNKGIERAGLIIALSKPLPERWKLTATAHSYFGLDGAPDRYKATMTALKPVGNNIQVGLYALGNKSEHTGYYEGGLAIVPSWDNYSMPIYLLTKSGGRVGIQVNMNISF